MLKPLHQNKEVCTKKEFTPNLFLFEVLPSRLLKFFCLFHHNFFELTTGFVGKTRYFLTGETTDYILKKFEDSKLSGKYLNYFKEISIVQ